MSNAQAVPVPLIAPTRRTQSQRKEETMRKLFDATRESLIEVGYANTSVSQICKRSGVSHGGLFRHFSSRIDLIIAVAQDVSNKLIDLYQARFEELTSAKDPFETALLLLRQNCRERDNQAWFELLVAARGDETLQQAMIPIWAENRARTLEYASRVFPDLRQSRPDFDSFIESIVNQFHGEAINAFIFSDGEADERRLRVILDFVRAYMSASIKE
jgi:AcrR family transcriptional regulator